MLTSHVGRLPQEFEGIRAGMQPKNGFTPTFWVNTSVICPHLESCEPPTSSPLLHSLPPSCCPMSLGGTAESFGDGFIFQQSPLGHDRALSTELHSLLCPCSWGGRVSASSPLLLILPPVCKPSKSGTSTPQLPAPEFGPSFLILPKNRWGFLLNWKRKIIPTYPVSKAAGISPKYWANQTQSNFFPVLLAQPNISLLVLHRGRTWCCQPQSLQQIANDTHLHSTYTQPSEFLLQRDPSTAHTSQHLVSSSVLQRVAQWCPLRTPTSTALSPPGPDTPRVSSV